MGEWGILVQKREGERSRRSCRSLGSYLQVRGTFVTCVVACEQSRVNLVTMIGFVQMVACHNLSQMGCFEKQTLSNCGEQPGRCWILPAT